MDWMQALENFNLVVENKSFTKAAENRYASSSALSKQISWLEDRLGTRLIQRTSRQIACTDAGQKLYRRSKHLLSEFSELKAEFTHARNEVKGPLTVAAPVTFGETILARELPKFLRQYPAIELQLELDNHFHDLIAENIDVAIRVGTITEKTLISKTIGKKTRGIFASPDYLKNNTAIQNLEELPEHACLAHSNFKNYNVWEFKKQSIRVKPHLVSNNLQLLINAAVAGEGIVYLSEYVVKNLIKEKKLMPILHEEWGKPVEHAIVYSRQPYISEKIKVFVSFLESIEF